MKRLTIGSLKNAFIQNCVLIFLTLIVFLASFFLSYTHVASYSFVDEFDNIAAAHFMLNGKTLYSEIFHNRQLGAVYLSYLIQFIFHPKTLYSLISLHRMFVYITSLFFGGVFIMRFRYPALLTVILLEITKFSLFGNFFQAENMIVYPVLILTGLCIQKKKLNNLETILSGLLASFIIFTRETYIPLTLFLFSFLIYRKSNNYQRLIMISIIVITSCAILFFIPIKEFLHSILVINSQKIFRVDIHFLKSFFYPIYYLFEGKFTYTKIVYSFICLGFLYSFFQKRNLLFIFLLFLSILRVVTPGSELYGAYKLLLWYGMITFITIGTIQKKSNIITALICGAFVSSVFLPQSPFWQKIDKNREFDIAYNRFFINGEIIKKLASKNDTLFVDGYDSLIFWIAQTPSSYRYTFYYPILKAIPQYADERIRMFKINPPTFYYKDCNDPYKLNIPLFALSDYSEFKSSTGKTCLFVRKEKLIKLSDEEKKFLNQFQYRL